MNGFAQLLLVAALVACSSGTRPTTAPAGTAPTGTAPTDTAPTDTAPPVEKQETTLADSCQVDADCFCRHFNGGQFTPGRAPSACCLEPAGCAGTPPVEAYHCRVCDYH